VRHVHAGVPELRLRFHGDPGFLWGELLGALRTRVSRCGDAIHHMRIDTYERELARYGGELGLTLVESLACRDSDWVIALLAAPAASAVLERRRFEIALLSAQRLVEDFALDLPRRHHLYGTRHAALAGQLDPETRFAVAAKLHDRRSAKVELPGEADAECRRLLDDRSAAIRPLVAALREAKLDERVLPSVVHHAVCRLFVSHEHAQELAVFTLLLRETERETRRGDGPGNAPREVR
jgi:thiopeptide-type bacteriocin biosynthesis protein